MIQKTIPDIPGWLREEQSRKKAIEKLNISYKKNEEYLTQWLAHSEHVWGGRLTTHNETTAADLRRLKLEYEQTKEQDDKALIHGWLKSRLADPDGHEVYRALANINTACSNAEDERHL